MSPVEILGQRVSSLNGLKEAGYKRVGTTAIIRSQDGKYLLVRENNSDVRTGKCLGTWSFPSEKSKVDENFLMTLARGLTEELPLEIVERLWLGNGFFIGEAGVVSIRARLATLLFEGESRAVDFSSPEIGECRWLSQEEILGDGYQLRPGMKELFEECFRRGLLSEKRFSSVRKLTAVSQRLTIVPSDVPDIAL